MTVADLAVREMPAPKKSTHAVPKMKRLLISLLAVLAAWMLFVLVTASLAILAGLTRPAASMSPWSGFLVISVGSLGVVKVIWIILIAPLTLIPSRSAFWKPPVLSVIGVIAGPLIVCVGAIYQLRSNPTIQIYDPGAYIVGGIVFPGLPAALIGGISGFLLGMLHAQLLKKETFPQ